MITSQFMQKGRIKESKEKFTNAEPDGLRIVLLPCSMDGKWEFDSQKAYSKIFNKLSLDFKRWSANKANWKPGKFSYTLAQSDLWVMTMLCFDENNKYIEGSLTKELKPLIDLCQFEKASIHLFENDLSLCEDKEKFVNELTKYGIRVYKYNLL